MLKKWNLNGEKLIERVKMGEERNKIAKPRKLCQSNKPVIIGKIGTNRVFRIKETKKKL